MGAGCFSWLTNKPPPKSKKNTIEHKPQSDNPVPTTFEYGKEGGKQVVRVLESAAGLIPIPYVQEVLQVALKIVDACEEVSAIEQQVLQLQARVCQLMMAIVDHLTKEPNADSIRDAGKTIEDEIKTLNSTLNRVVEDLAEIKRQNRWLLIIFKDLNKAKVNECMDQLTTSMELFKFSNELHTADSLRRIQTRLEDIHKLTEQVSNQVTKLDAKVDTGITTIMNALNGAKARKATLLLARQPMPLKPRIFHGRNDLVEEVVYLLVVEKTSHVCILGPGGMGKTSLALAIVESPTIQSKFTKKNRFWVPCIEATSTTLFLQILYTSLQITRDTKDPLEDILYELAASDEPRLILLDNFETTWNALNHTQSQVNVVLRRLAELDHVALLVTMRGTHPPTDDIIWQPRNLPPTDAEACRQIYHDINPGSKDDPHIDKLLRAIGYMPFAVTLMATLGKEGKSSAKTLLDEWSRTGTDMLSDTTEERSMNRSISLSVDSALMKRNPDALTLLATLAMLPAGTARHRLNDWASSLKSLPRAIATLSNAGLLMMNDGGTSDSISNEIKQDVCHACYSYISAHQSRAGDPGFKTDAEALGAEDTNIQSIFQGVFSSYNCPTTSTTESLDSFLAFNWYLHDTKPNIELAMQALKVSGTTSNNKQIAESLFCLGSTYSKLDQFERSREHLQKAYDIFRDISKSDPASKSVSLSRAGRCGLDLAECMLYLMEPSLAVQVLEVVEEDLAVSDDVHGQALRLIELGKAYRCQENYTTALIYLEDGKGRLEKLDRPADLAKCLIVICDTHYTASNFSKGLEVGEQALKIVEGLSHDSEYLRARITHILSMCLSQLNRTTEALDYEKIALVNCEITTRPFGVGQVWERIGFIYLLQSKLEDAHAAYQAAFDTWASLGSTRMVENSRDVCLTNMQKIRLKQHDPMVHVELHGTDLDKAFGFTMIRL